MDLEFNHIGHDDIEPLMEAGALKILLYSHGRASIPGARRIRDHGDPEAATSIVHAEVFGVPLEARYARSRHMFYDGDLRRPRLNDEIVRCALADALRIAWPDLPSEVRDAIDRVRIRNVPATARD